MDGDSEDEGNDELTCVRSDKSENTSNTCQSLSAICTMAQTALPSWCHELGICVFTLVCFVGH